MTGPIDYQAVLADLEAKRGTLDAAIAGIRAIIAGTVVETSTASENGASAPALTSGMKPQPHARTDSAGIQSDTFFRLSTAEAIKKFLAMTKRPQTPRAIADALRAGGQVHAANEKSAYGNTYTALMRLRKSGEVAQTRQGDWGMAEWYTNKPKDAE